MMQPILYTVLTTICAFLSLIFSGIKPIIDFGWMMTLGLVVSLSITFTLLPAILTILTKKNTNYSGGSSPNGSVRNNTASSGGSATVNASVLTSGNFKESDGSAASIPSASTLTQGPVGSYNQSGSGVAGVTGQNCSGDNCQIAGKNGGASYAGNIAGGTGRFGSTGDAGTRGSGGGGGGAQPQSSGGAGGTGEIRYRFLRVQ